MVIFPARAYKPDVPTSDAGLTGRANGCVTEHDTPCGGWAGEGWALFTTQKDFNVIEQTTAAPAKKRRPPPRPAVVGSIERVTPGVIRVAFTGDDLASFAQTKPAGHMKLFFAPPDRPLDLSPDAPRPPSRTFTPRRYDAARRRLEVEFALHGEGLASNWAMAARVGDPMLLSGPGGGYPIPEGIQRIVIVADDTAIPAAGMIIEALPRDCEVTVLCEIASAADERALSPTVACRPSWLHRAPGAARPGALLEAAAASLSPQRADTCWWVGCEAGAMRRIRDGLLRGRGVAPALLHTRGYWKAGDQNYPDHDYGAD